MTFNEYINNPAGKANAVISHREMYRNMYTEKLNKIMVRENGKVDYTLYETNKSYICHIKVPSEVISNFYYDVVVQFIKDKSASRNLSDSDIKFYSNDPSFVFTFAHAFIKNKIFITDLEEKMSKKAIKEKADEKNPKDEIGYVKSLYFAYILMYQRGLFNTIKYEAEKKPYSDKILKYNIIHADEKIEARQEAQKKLNEINKKEKQDKKRNKQNPIQTKQEIIGSTSYASNNASIKYTKTSKSINKSNNINGIKHSKKTNRI